MEYYDSEERSTPDSYSTSDYSSQTDLLVNFSTNPQKKTKQKKLKLIIKSTFASILSEQIHLINDPLELKSWINQQISQEPIEILVEKFKFKCCNTQEHATYCEKKWNKVRKELIKIVDENLQEPKPIFSITKREKDSRLLLDYSQPCWIHKLIVQSLFIGNKIID